MTATSHRHLSETANVFRLLGGNKGLGSRPRNERDYIRIVRAGLPYNALRSATAALALPFKALEHNLHLNTRTMLRRKNGRLTPIESERVMRLVRVAARAEHVLGARDAALDWLESPNRALDGQQPLALLDTDLGTDQVLQVLGRLEHGVYA